MSADERDGSRNTERNRERTRDRDRQWDRDRELEREQEREQDRESDTDGTERTAWPIIAMAATLILSAAAITAGVTLDGTAGRLTVGGLLIGLIPCAGRATAQLIRILRTIAATADNTTVTGTLTGSIRTLGPGICLLINGMALTLGIIALVLIVAMLIPGEDPTMPPPTSPNPDAPSTTILEP